MNQIVRTYPLALYYPLRTLYLKLKNDEQTEKFKNQLLSQQQQQQQLKLQQQSNTNSATIDVEMKDLSNNKSPSLNPSNSLNQPAVTQVSSECLIRVTTLMHRQRELHPTL